MPYCYHCNTRVNARPVRFFPSWSGFESTLIPNVTSSDGSQSILNCSQYYCQSCFDRLYQTCPRCNRLSYAQNMRTLRNVNNQTHKLCDTCWSELSTWEIGANTIEMSSTPFTYNVIGSKRKFGVEIETSRCPNYRSLYRQTGWGVKYDGSIAGMEFVSPILQGDRGLEVVKELCVAGRKLGWQTNSDCGLHIHCDMHNETEEVCKRVAYAYAMTYNMWRTFVTPFRAYDCRYCQSLTWTPQEIEASENWFRDCHQISRYCGVNFAALSRHGTYEIRLHQGSLNYRAISAWIRLHLRFIDSVKEMQDCFEVFQTFGTTYRQNWKALKTILKDQYLNRYFGRRYSQHTQFLESVSV